MLRSHSVLFHQKINLPKVRRLIRILDSQIKSDAPTAIIDVTSEKGFLGIQVSGTTQGTPWLVELYGGCCYIVKVHGRQPEKVKTPLHVVTFLKAHLPCSPSPSF